MTKIMKDSEKVGLVLGFLTLPINWILKDTRIGHARSLGFTSLYICSPLGLLGAFASIRNESLIFGPLNPILIGSLFLIINPGYLTLD